eukprot:g3846.t1
MSDPNNISREENNSYHAQKHAAYRRAEVVQEGTTSYAEAMRDRLLEKEKRELEQKLRDKERDIYDLQQIKSQNNQNDKGKGSESSSTTTNRRKRRSRFDMGAPPTTNSSTTAPTSAHVPPPPGRQRRSRFGQENPPPPPPPQSTTDYDTEAMDEVPVHKNATTSQLNNPFSNQSSTSAPSSSLPGSTSSQQQQGQQQIIAKRRRKRRSRWDEEDDGSSTTVTTTTTSGKNGSIMQNGSKVDQAVLLAKQAAARLAGIGINTEQTLDESNNNISSAADPTTNPDGYASTASIRLHRLTHWERELAYRNRPLSDDDLNAILPSKGYKIVEPPANYVPIHNSAKKQLNVDDGGDGMGGGGEGSSGFFTIQDSSGQKLRPEDFGIAPTQEDMEKQGLGGLPFIPQEDMAFFGDLINIKIPEGMTAEEYFTPKDLQKRTIMKYLLLIKNGQPSQRKVALRKITINASTYGAAPLFEQILPIFTSPTLEDQQRHIMVKVIDRVLYKLGEKVKPFVHKILVVIEPMLIDADFYARTEGREIIANLSKAAGLACMIATMRPDIDHVDEYVRNTTARAMAVVASALGIPALIPFLKAVCASRKSWQARHTGAKVVQQIAILMGAAILPHLSHLVLTIGPHGLHDENPKVRTITAQALSALAEAASPYGIESFDEVIIPLWKGVKRHRSKGLAAFLKAIGYIVPLMTAHHASYYTKEIMNVLIREFASPDDEMKKVVLGVVQRTSQSEGVTSEYLKESILPKFFEHFWVRRMALDRRNYKQVVTCTVELANKVGVAEIVGRIVMDLKDDSEAYRRMVIDAIEQVIANLGASDVDEELEEKLVDGVIYAFQAEGEIEDAIAMEQSQSAYEAEKRSRIVLDGFSTIINALGVRAKPYIPQLCGTIRYRLTHKTARVRMQAADLVQKLANIMHVCGEEKLLTQLSLVLFENIGEEYPDVLGSILGGIGGVVSVVGMESMKPPIGDLVPRLTPILRNRHEKVQEFCIDLIGKIADRGSNYVSAREWMRIVFELLESLKASKKSIRRATVSTFGFIAKAIGPQDVIHTLLNNLRVQERQLRVCTTVAIAIVAESCSPFTVLPALMNEYRVPDLNVQNGVLKALSFIFEYIGSMGKDYCYAVIPLLESALTNRDHVHRQTACAVVKHLALGVAGHGLEDAMLHLLNFVWPNLLEESHHVIKAVLEAIEALRLCLGAGVITQYLLQGLFHPARSVREAYWRIYNNAYVYAPEAVSAAIPVLPDDMTLARNYRDSYGDVFL